MRIFFLILISFFLPISGAQAQVVASIKPVHSLLLNLTKDTPIESTLLVDGASSLHDFSLKPSQAIALKNAKLVVYVSDDMELFLEKPLSALPAEKKLELMNAQGLTRLPVRTPEVHEEEEEHEHHEHHHEHEHHEAAYDGHVWLSVENARTMSRAIAAALSSQFPEQAATIKANERKLDAQLAKLGDAIALRMKLLAGKGFATFHDSTQYFDRAYGLTYIGSLTVHPERGLSAGKIKKLRGEVLALKAPCVFREPQFDTKVIDNVMQGTGAKSSVLDTEAALIPSGSELYFTLMDQVAASMQTCLQ